MSFHKKKNHILTLIVLFQKYKSAREKKIGRWQNSGCLTDPQTSRCNHTSNPWGLLWINNSLGIDNRFSCEKIKHSHRFHKNDQ